MATLDPVTGHEQAGRRPVLVVSNNEYNRFMGGLYVVCPISNTANRFPMHVLLDNRTQTTGSILCQHLRTVDLNQRNAQKKEECPEDILDEVLEIITSSFI